MIALTLLSKLFETTIFSGFMDLQLIHSSRAAGAASGGRPIRGATYAVGGLAARRWPFARGRHYRAPRSR